MGFITGAAALYVYENKDNLFTPAPVPVKAPAKDVAAVAKDIAALLEDTEYEDGSRGPLFVRLAWHCAGTYDKNTNTGGSNGATMRFREESSHGANAGLYLARALLEPIKQKHPWISYADLYTLAGVVAVKELGGPSIEWKSGRSDAADRKSAPPDGRLPDAAQGQSHIRNIFYRMGLDDREIVALAGAHALGRCHTDRSGFSGPWTRSPTSFTNAYFTELLGNKWTKKNWNGPVQYEDPTKELMMLPADLAFIQDPNFKQWVVKYAEDEDLFFADFAGAFKKLLELGVPFPADSISYNPQ
jgi:catalase (peroxidase I)